MLKWLLLFVLGYVAFRWWSRASLSRPSGSADGRIEDMAECAQCGVHFPQGEAVISEGRPFCCEQHCSEWKQCH